MPYSASVHRSDGSAQPRNRVVSQSGSLTSNVNHNSFAAPCGVLPHIDNHAGERPFPQCRPRQFRGAARVLTTGEAGETHFD